MNEVVKCSAEEDDANGDEQQGGTTSEPRNSMTRSSSGHSSGDRDMGKSRDSKGMKRCIILGEEKSRKMNASFVIPSRFCFGSASTSQNRDVCATFMSPLKKL